MVETIETTIIDTSDIFGPGYALIARRNQLIVDAREGKLTDAQASEEFIRNGNFEPMKILRDAAEKSTLKGIDQKVQKNVRAALAELPI